MPLKTADESLNCYASGDGALHFTWAKIVHPRTCTGRTVTRQDVEDYLASDEAKHLRTRGWRIWEYGSHFHIIAPVKRISPEVLELEGRQYTVSNVTKFNDSNRIVRQLMLVTTVHPELGTVEVRNISTLAALAHFIEHEELIPALDLPQVTA